MHRAGAQGNKDGLEVRRRLVKQLSQPDVAVQERAATPTHVAPWFLALATTARLRDEPCNTTTNCGAQLTRRPRPLPGRLGPLLGGICRRHQTPSRGVGSSPAASRNDSKFSRVLASGGLRPRVLTRTTAPGTGQCTTDPLGSWISTTPAGFAKWVGSGAPERERINTPSPLNPMQPGRVLPP